MQKRVFGGLGYYKNILSIAIPIIIQSGITNFVNLLDNIMVGQVGTVPMSGVSIVNGLLFVFNLCVFGASSGAGIFTAQFHGSKDETGVRHTFRFKVLSCILLTLAGVLIFTFAGETIIGLYLTGEGDPAMAAEVLQYGRKYLRIMMWGFLPFALSNAYSSTLRETGAPLVPMVAGICAVFVNLILNYILIFGHLGFDAMGVEGAAIATVISRFVELSIVAAWTHTHPNHHGYIRGVFRSFHIPGKLLKNIIFKGMPLMINEFLWASGMATITQCYSTCGLDVVPALNISRTLFDVGGVVFISLGNAVGIIMGQMLGSGLGKEEIRWHNRKLMTFATVVGGSFGLLMIGASHLFPLLYNTTGEVRLLAARLICINGLMLPFNSYTNASYYTLRSGGQALVTFLFDSCFVWGLCVPLAYCLSRFTGIPILTLYCIVQATELIKCLLGGYMIRQGKWIQNLTV
ncbi:MAG: MATE family efflux transporter [Oscillospiraceae bacterium]|nr:MATE family efflux transporter [Oscillospiraceae bacterium]